ncbi:MAG: hypothetical protein SW833_12535 [Cyanobacteriota bacterium]|nr:hypothetical protein [Cyanobacteriota bacterium]
MRYLDKAADIRDAICEFSLCDRLWLDTETARVYNPPQILSLIQVTADADDLEGNSVTVLDMLYKPDLIEEFVHRVMVNPQIEKIFHNASFDVKHLGGKERVCNVTCTYKIAQGISLHRLGTSNLKLKTLAKQLCGFKNVIEDEGRSNWEQRPLSNRQLQYAKMDVVYLAQVHLYLMNWQLSQPQLSLPLPEKSRSQTAKSYDYSAWSWQDKCQRLIELSIQKNNIQSYVKNQRNFRDRQEQIGKAVTELQPLAKALTVFRHKKLLTLDSNQNSSPRLNSLLDLIQEAEEQFQKNPDSIVENRNFQGKNFKNSVDGLHKILQEQLLQAWSNYLGRRMPSTNPEMLTLLARIETFKPTVETIKRLDKSIPRRDFPKNSEEFEAIEQQIAQLREAWQNLSSEEVPEAVLRFLKAASAGGAPLSLLTLEVQNWLDRHQLSQALKVCFT